MIVSCREVTRGRSEREGEGEERERGDKRVKRRPVKREECEGCYVGVGRSILTISYAYLFFFIIPLFYFSYSFHWLLTSYLLNIIASISILLRPIYFHKLVRARWHKCRTFNNHKLSGRLELYVLSFSVSGEYSQYWNLDVLLDPLRWRNVS